MFSKTDQESLLTDNTQSTNILIPYDHFNNDEQIPESTANQISIITNDDDEITQESEVIQEVKEGNTTIKYHNKIIKPYSISSLSEYNDLPCNIKQQITSDYFKSETWKKDIPIKIRKEIRLKEIMNHPPVLCCFRPVDLCFLGSLLFSCMSLGGVFFGGYEVKKAEENDYHYYTKSPGVESSTYPTYDICMEARNNDPDANTKITCEYEVNGTAWLALLIPSVFCTILSLLCLLILLCKYSYYCRKVKCFSNCDFMKIILPSRYKEDDFTHQVKAIEFSENVSS